MIRSRARWLLLSILASVGQPPLADGAPQLVSGVELPPLEAKTLTGDATTLPRDAQGHPAVLVIGFSKASAKITRPWLESCRSTAAAGPSGSEVFCYDVRMLEEVPRLFRGSMERGMRSGLPVDLQRRTLLVYEGNEPWRDRVSAVDENTAYVIGCDRKGRVVATGSGRFVETELKKILEAIEAMPPKSE